MSPQELIVDSFAGGGGASLGIHMALGRGPDIAINHDAEAIALHAANHPEARHYCENVWQVDPLEATGGRPVGLMWLSPDCKHFSKAKGGKPVAKKVRGLAWVAVRWAKAVRPRVIVLENVEEFQTWGPVLRETNRPCPERRGETFRLFVRRLTRLGYDVQWRELRACDYGAPTIRKRLFLVARCDGQPIVWPAPTHGKGTPHPWRTAAECIDWSLPCLSIFASPEEARAFAREHGGRSPKRPLAENTLRRIGRGVGKFVIDDPRPFVVPLRGTKPNQLVAHDLAAPLSTVSAQGTHHALVAPVLVPRYGERDGQAPRAARIDRPMATIVPTANGGALVAAFLAKHYSERSASEVQGASLFDPMPTVTTTDHNALVTVSLGGSAGRREQVRSFLVAYYGGEADGQSLFEPMRTVTSRDHFGLVTVAGEGYEIADIGMRMLTPRERYRAQGFPDSYVIELEFQGKPLSQEAQGRMVGNSVVPVLAAAIVRANLGAEPAATERAA